MKWKHKNIRWIYRLVHMRQILVVSLHFLTSDLYGLFHVRGSEFANSSSIRMTRILKHLMPLATWKHCRWARNTARHVRRQVGFKVGQGIVDPHLWFEVEGLVQRSWPHWPHEVLLIHSRVNDGKESCNDDMAARLRSIGSCARQDFGSGLVGWRQQAPNHRIRLASAAWIFLIPWFCIQSTIDLSGSGCKRPEFWWFRNQEKWPPSVLCSPLPIHGFILNSKVL